MSEVQRYRSAALHGDGWAEEDSDGDLVEYKDYATLKAERDALAAENAAMLEAINQTIGWQESVDAANTESTRLLREIKTVATDAFLLNVQADGVDKLSELHNARMEELKRSSREGAPRPAGYSFHQAACFDAKLLSKKLRAQAEALKGGDW